MDFKQVFENIFTYKPENVHNFSILENDVRKYFC